MPGINDGLLAEDGFRESRVLGYKLTVHQTQMSGLIGTFLDYEQIELMVEGELPEGSQTTLKKILELDRTEIKRLLSEWLRTAEDLEIAVVYFAADSHLFERMAPLGCLFAEFLCDEIGAERVLQIAALLHECPEQERLERIAAELSERGGG